MKTLRRRQQVPEGNRTEARDAAASWIEDEVLSEDRWPMTYTNMAEESGWSRQHIANTIENYFVEVDTEDDQIGHEVSNVFEAYRRGYSDGWEDGYERGTESN